MERKGLYLLVTIALAIAVTSAADGPPKGEDKAAAAASKIVEALEDHPFRADSVAPELQSAAVAGSQDHPKGRIVPRKGVFLGNVTSSVNATVTTTSTSIAASVPKATEAQHKNITTTAAPPHVSVANSSAVVGPANATVSSNSTQQPANITLGNNATTPAVAVPSASKPTTVTSSTTTTTTTTSTMTTTTTTTTKPPKKPTITLSVEDEPKLVQAAKPGYGSGSSGGATVSDPSGRLHVEEPLAELSKEYMPSQNPGHREYILPVVTLIFAIPLLAGLFLLSYRRAKEFWLTRHYRRMDFLVDGMYNY